MALHPPIAKKLVDIVDCAQYNEERVLSGFKDIECGSGLCTAVAAVFTLLYTLGVPVYVFLSLRAYLSPPARERYKDSPILARYKARIGFICGKYEAGFWYYELLEMTRKTGLMAITSFIQKGSYVQLFAKMLISGCFLVVLVRCTPFNSDRLDLLVCTSQFCSFATLFFMLMMKIGFFEEERVDVGAMNAVLMLIMFFPLFARRAPLEPTPLLEPTTRSARVETSTSRQGRRQAASLTPWRGLLGLEGEAWLDPWGQP